MAEKLSTIVLCASKSVRKQLKSQLAQMEQLELGPMLRDPGQVLELVRSSRADILILDIPENSKELLKLIEQVKSEHPQMAVFVTSAAKNPDLVISAMRAGAQEFLSQPILTTELTQALERVQKSRQQVKTEAPKARGKIISVFSKKGGQGVTSLAVNLAAALSYQSEKKAALIDLDLQLGDVTSFLNLSPEYTILDCLDKNGEADPVKIQSCLTRHESGVYVLPEPRNPIDSENVSAAQIVQILKHLRSMFSYVVVDTPHSFDSRNLAAFELSDQILVVMVPNISSLRAAKKTLGALSDSGFDESKVRLILNRSGKRDQLGTHEIEQTLHYPISWVIPNNYPVALEAINTGIPLVNHDGRSNVAKSIQGLADDLPKLSRTMYIELDE
jgi:pilus assembly protein CpaE